MDESCVMTWTGNRLIARLSGEVDHHRASRLRDLLDREIRSAAEKHCLVDLIFDFEDVTFMDSSGIGVVMGRYNIICETGGTVYVTGCGPYVERILEMSGVFLITKKRKNVQEALDESEGRVKENHVH